jgi:aspartyl/asparaginyl beta-hydroxylase
MIDGRYGRLCFGLDCQFDIAKLRTATEKLLAEVPLAYEQTRQIALQTFTSSTDPWYDGTRRQSQIGRDTDYDQLVPGLRGTYFEELFAALPFKPFRARLMSLDPKIAYSVHRDETPRFHIAINTSEHARFVFTEKEHVIHIPADGRVYFVDTREEHTAFNGGSEPRLHLVVGGAEPDL